MCENPRPARSEDLTFPCLNVLDWIQSHKTCMLSVYPLGPFVSQGVPLTMISFIFDFFLMAIWSTPLSCVSPAPWLQGAWRSRGTLSRWYWNNLPPLHTCHCSWSGWLERAGPLSGSWFLCHRCCLGCCGQPCHQCRPDISETQCCNPEMMNVFHFLI